MDTIDFLKYLAVKDNSEVTRHIKLEIIDFLIGNAKIEISENIYVSKSKIDKILFQFIKSGEKIKAIKSIMLLTNDKIGLREGKRIVDKWQQEYEIK